MPIVKGKGTYMTLISSKYYADFFTGATSDVWVQSFSYGPKWTSEIQNSFGSNDPVVIDDTYDGVKASFDIIETQSKAAVAILTRQTLASAVGFDPSLYNESYLYANFKNTKWATGGANTDKWLGSVLLKKLKVVAADSNSAVDGVMTKKFDFDGTGVVEFKIPIAMEQFTGDNVNTVFSTFGNGSTPKDGATGFTLYNSNYIQLLLVDDVAKVKTTDYTETDLNTVTMGTAPAVAAKITVLGVYTPV